MQSSSQDAPRCPVCAATAATVYAEFAEYRWLRCRCGVIFKSGAADGAPVEEPAAADAFGDTAYGQRYHARTRHRIAKSRRQIADALEFVADDTLRSRGRVLDIGCSLGYTLAGGTELGLEAVGTDISRVAVEHCRSLGFEAEQAGLESLPFPDAHFAVVTMKHVLEHTPAPAAALREVRRVLAPGGALFVAVPHAGYRKAVRDPRRSPFYRPDSHGGREHWVYYTPATLAPLLAAEGFTVRRVHPLLLHRKAPMSLKLLEMLVAPARAVGAAVLGAASLRKEFWTVATRG